MNNLYAFRMPRLHRMAWLVAAVIALSSSLVGNAQATDEAKPEPDVLVLRNGDTLHGQFVNEIDGKVTFHTNAFGDMTLSWAKIKELHTAQKFAVLSDQQKVLSKKAASQLPTGTVRMQDQSVALQSENGTAEPAIPVKNAQYIMDAATLDKQINHEPSFFSAWNGAATAGATIVSATQKQYTFSGAIGLVRTVPPVAWLSPRNRTSIDFIGSLGKITQPSYIIPGTPTVVVPAVTAKSTIYHADAERDQYFSPRMFALVETAFDHNYSQDLDLQQIYGAGIGWTLIKTPKQEADLKATIQYEKQKFISSPNSANLIGSTLAAAYVLHTRLLTYTQGVAYIPAFNDWNAYSANETNTLAFPAYKNLGFSVGTIDSYLNNPPASLPPTQRNSFQFTMGFTYALRSKY